MSFTPMLASSPDPRSITAAELLSDDGWAMDVKADGVRCTVVIENSTLITVGRDGQRLNRVPTAVIRQLAPLVAGSYVLDGELVDGTLYLFDLVRAGEVVTEADPWTVRRAALDTVLGTWEPGTGVVRGVPYATTEADKLALVNSVVVGRGEGLVAKRIGSPYRQGVRTRDWLKVKRHHHIDCVVMWLGVDKANMGVGVYDGDQLIEVAEVGRLTGDGARCEIGNVVEVRCLYSSEANRLYQPTLPRLRFDKPAIECNVDQLDAARTNPMLLAELTGDPT